MRMLHRACVLSVILGLCAYASGTFAGGAKEAPKVGDKAPVFEAKDESGKAWKSTDHVGKKIIVVYFYPADFTGGCTKQACAFRDDFKVLTDAGVEVVGVSGDTPETHAAFKKFHKLNFTLLADTKGEVAKKFGVPVTVGKKTVSFTIDGNKEDFTREATTSRWTFVIDQKGNIVHVDTKVNAAEDSKKIQEVVNKLKTK